MKYFSILCMLLCAAMLMGLIAGCGTQEPVETQTSAPISQSSSEEPKVEEDVPAKGEDSLNPHIVFHDDGSVSDDGDLYFSVVDKEFISRRFAELKAFSEETGVAVMLQEFGVRYEADYDDTLGWFEDMLSAANENGLNWCGWDYFGAYSFFAVNDEIRQGATYEPFSYGMIATELYDVFKSHLLTGK